LLSSPLLQPSETKQSSFTLPGVSTTNSSVSALYDSIQNSTNS